MEKDNEFKYNKKKDKPLYNKKRIRQFEVMNDKKNKF